MSPMSPDDPMIPGGGPPRRPTLVVPVDPAHPDADGLRGAARCLRHGGLVVFPTETVYGLGADATDGRAVASVFEAKGRPADNPLIVHVASPADVAPLVRNFDPRAEALMRAFWPGPLSLVLPKTSLVASEVSCGLDTVAVRMPRHPVALELVRLAGVPVAAPSANASGRPSPTRASDALADLDGRVDYILDAGPCPVGVESTVLDLSGPVPTVLRPGGVTLEELREVIGQVELLHHPAGLGDPAGPAGPARSPGLRHRHYKPKARLVLVLPGVAAAGTSAARAGDVTSAALARAVAAELASGRKVGVACSNEAARTLASGALPAGALPAGAPNGPRVIAWGRRGQPAEVAAGLFSALRDLDALDVDVIVAEGALPEGLGLAINDRLGRAAAAVVTAESAGPGAEITSSTGRVALEPETVLLVCSGNTCRSPMGQAILGNLLSRVGLDRAYRVDSAGTSASAGQPASPEACQVMGERGLDLEAHRSKPVTPDLVRSARLILTMTGRHREALLELCPWAADRVYTLRGYAGAGEGDIADPIGLGLEAYRVSAGEIDRAAAGVVERLRSLPDLNRLLESGEDQTQ